MTKFTTMKLIEKTKNKKTIFHKVVDYHKGVCEAGLSPGFYDNILFLYTDHSYGDVFLAWNDSREKDRVIYFGEKGDKFND